MAKEESVQQFVTVIKCKDCSWNDLEFESDEKPENQSKDLVYEPHISRFIYYSHEGLA